MHPSIRPSILNDYATQAEPMLAKLNARENKSDPPAPLTPPHHLTPLTITSSPPSPSSPSSPPVPPQPHYPSPPPSSSPLRLLDSHPPSHSPAPHIPASSPTPSSSPPYHPNSPPHTPTACPAAEATEAPGCGRGAPTRGPAAARERRRMVLRQVKPGGRGKGWKSRRSSGLAGGFCVWAAAGRRRDSGRRVVWRGGARGLGRDRSGLGLERERWWRWRGWRRRNRARHGPSPAAVAWWVSVASTGRTAAATEQARSAGKHWARSRSGASPWRSWQ